MISIIIPTYNEGDQVEETIRKARAAIGGAETEFIVADGGSSDDTVSIANKNGATTIVCDRKGRGAQMNQGADIAKGELLYFLHADTTPPENFSRFILQAYNQGYTSGCFKLSFDYQHWFLKANAWFTRFNVNCVRFGDQSLFVTRDVFNKVHGFREDLLLMEDQEIIHRLRRHGNFKVMNAAVITSARKYVDNGVYRMQGIFFRIWLMYYLGYSQSDLLQLYKKLIRKHKL